MISGGHQSHPFVATEERARFVVRLMWSGDMGLRHRPFINYLHFIDAVGPINGLGDPHAPAIQKKRRLPAGAPETALEIA